VEKKGAGHECSTIELLRSKVGGQINKHRVLDQYMTNAYFPNFLRARSFGENGL